MISAHSKTTVVTDSGFVAEVLHVSPVFVRVGPRVRGRFEIPRLARVRRSEARWAARRPVPSLPAQPDLGYARWRLDA